MWWMIGLAVAGTLIVLYLVGRRNELMVERDWEILFSQRAAAELRTDGLELTEAELAELRAGRRVFISRE